MREEVKVFLKHILESISLIETYTADISREDFLKSQAATGFDYPEAGDYWGGYQAPSSQVQRAASPGSLARDCRNARHDDSRVLRH